MSMKRTIPGGRIDAVFTKSREGKEVIATKIDQDEAETTPCEESIEVVAVVIVEDEDAEATEAEVVKE